MHPEVEALDERQPLLPPRAYDEERVPQIPRRPLSKPHTREDPKPPLSRTSFLVIALFGIFLANADESLVTATYGAISSSFEDLEDGSWILLAYNLGYCVALPVYGNLSDIYGRKIPLLVAYCLFAAGCAISGTAHSLVQVVLGRFVAGVGGSGMIDMISVIISEISGLGDTAILRSYTNVANIVGRSAGGPVGGLLADTIGWRWSFIGQTPLALLWALVLAWKLPSTGPSSSTQSKSPQGSVMPKWKYVDWIGVVLFPTSIGTAVAIFQFKAKGFDWDDQLIVALIVACTFCTVIFLLNEGLVARQPLFPLKMLATTETGAFCVVQMLQFAARFGFQAEIAPYFIRTGNVSTSLAGAYIAPGAIGNAVGALVTGYFISRTLRYKGVSIYAIPIGMLSYIVILLRWPNGIHPAESLYVFGAGISLGITISAQFIGLAATAPPEQRGTAMSAYYLSQQIGIIGGVGGTAAILKSTLSKTLRRNLAGRSDVDKIIGGVLSESRFAFTLPKEVRDIVIKSYLKSFRWVPVLSICLTMFSLPFVTLPKEKPLA